MGNFSKEDAKSHKPTPSLRQQIMRNVKKDIRSSKTSIKMSHGDTAKRQFNKVWGELEIITSEINKKRNNLLKESDKNNLVEIINNNSKIKKSTNCDEDYIEKSKENLAHIEERLKALDAIKDETFVKLNEYVERAKTARNEKGELILEDGDKIDDLAAVVKDYQRESCTDFDKDIIPELYIKEE